jgi:uncharacterized protein YukE
MTSGAFPITPTGSPGAIENLAASLTAANSGFGSCASALRQTASGLGGIDWQGPAEARFSSAAAGLARAADAYHDTLSVCAKALRTYASALQAAQKTIDAAREDYEAAKAAQADAAIILKSLSGEQGRATDAHERSMIGGQIDDQHAAAGRASSSAEAALARATTARAHFDRAHDRAQGVLDGTSPPSTPFLGPGAAPFTNRTAGGGILGGAFGVRPGGLGNYSGEVPWNQRYDVDGLAASSFDDRNGQTEVDDLDNAIDALALATGIGGVAKIGLSLAKKAARRIATRSATKKAERVAAERVKTPAQKAQDLADRNQLYVEKFGETASQVGVPQADNVAKVLAVATNPAVRAYLQIKFGQALARIAATGGSIRKGLATLRAARALQQGVRRGIPKEAVERLEQITNEAMKGGRNGT